MNLNSYATLTAFRTRQGLATADTGDDARMLSKLRTASRSIERFTGRVFYPTLATKRFDCPQGNTLLLRGADLLAITTLTNGDASLTVIPSTDYALLGGEGGPVWGIEVNNGLNAFYYNTTRTQAISVLGFWGWHDEYATSAWRLSSEVIAGGGITSSATTIITLSALGSDSWGLSPRFSAGMLARVDSEYMHVIAVSSDGLSMTVVRGANGTTAATHSAAAPIYTYMPPAEVPELCLRWAAWLLKTEDSGDYVGETADQTVGSSHVAGSLPRDLFGALSNLKRVGSY